MTAKQQQSTLILNSSFVVLSGQEVSVIYEKQSEMLLHIWLLRFARRRHPVACSCCLTDQMVSPTAAAIKAVVCCFKRSASTSGSIQSRQLYAYDFENFCGDLPFKSALLGYQTIRSLVDSDLINYNQGYLNLAHAMRVFNIDKKTWSALSFRGWAPGWFSSCTSTWKIQSSSRQYFPMRIQFFTWRNSVFRIIFHFSNLLSQYFCTEPQTQPNACWRCFPRRISVPPYPVSACIDHYPKIREG